MASATEHHAAATLVRDHLADVLAGEDALATRARWSDLVHAVRNIGLPGPASDAISAIHSALRDLTARLWDVALGDLLRARRGTIPVYGSGGSSSSDDDRLASQLASWVDDGIPRVTMKMGRESDRDVERVRTARSAVGPDAELYVDGNGALSRDQVLGFTEAFAAHLPKVSAGPATVRTGFARVLPLRHTEWSHDHVRIGRQLFDGVVGPQDGQLTADRSRPGHGLVLKQNDAEPYRIA